VSTQLRRIEWKGFKSLREMDLDLRPLNVLIGANWRDRDSNRVFGPHQLPDGTLRAMCLITLLLQPMESLPALLLIDESDLRWHPYALQLLASLIHKATHPAQILISTQSSALLSLFEPEDVNVVDRTEQGSGFRRLESKHVFVRSFDVLHARTKTGGTVPSSAPPAWGRVSCAGQEFRSELARFAFDSRRSRASGERRSSRTTLRGRDFRLTWMIRFIRGRTFRSTRIACASMIRPRGVFTP